MPYDVAIFGKCTNVDRLHTFKTVLFCMQDFKCEYKSVPSHTEPNHASVSKLLDLKENHILFFVQFLD